MRGAGCALTFFDHCCQHVATEFTVCFFSLFCLFCSNLKVQWEGLLCAAELSYINGGAAIIKLPSYY